MFVGGLAVSGIEVGCGRMFVGNLAVGGIEVGCRRMFVGSLAVSGIEVGCRRIKTHKRLKRMPFLIRHLYKTTSVFLASCFFFKQTNMQIIQLQ